MRARYELSTGLLTHPGSPRCHGTRNHRRAAAATTAASLVAPAVDARMTRGVLSSDSLIYFPCRRRDTGSGTLAGDTTDGHDQAFGGGTRIQLQNEQF